MKKIKILLNYFYKQYPFCTASYIEMAAKKDSDIEVFKVGQIKPSDVDLIFNIEQCPEIITFPGVKSCYWEIDNHINRGARIDRYNAVDWVFIAQKGYLPLYPKNKTLWLPLACDPEKHKEFKDEPIKYDIGFLGNDTYPIRQDLLNKLNRRYKLLRSTSEPGEPYSRLLSQCRFLFNRSMNNDMNMRVFEALSVGRLFFTDKVEGMDDLFVDGEDYICFKDWDDLRELIDYYLSKPKEAEGIAKHGQEVVRYFHTYKNRLDEVLAACSIKKNG